MRKLINSRVMCRGTRFNTRTSATYPTDVPGFAELVVVEETNKF